MIPKTQLPHPALRAARAISPQDRAQQDLARLLRQLKRPAPEAAPSKAVPKPATPAPARPAAPSAPSALVSTLTGARVTWKWPAPGVRSAILLLTGLSAVALAMSFLGFTVLSADVSRTQGTLRGHSVELGELRSKQDKLRSEVETRIAGLHALIAEVRYPPSGFAQAQDLFRARRFADAEAAYTAFLLQHPNSRVADVVLNNAAVAAAMQGNCTMAAAHVKQLKAQFPASPFNSSMSALTVSCRRLREARSAQ